MDRIVGSSSKQHANATVVTGTAASTTLNIFDSVDMGTGTDTLFVNYGGTAATVAASALPTLTGVEHLSLSSLSGASTLNGTIAPALTTLTIASPTATAGMTATLVPAAMLTLNLSSFSVDDQDTSLTYATGALSGASDTFTLNVTGLSAATTATAAAYGELALVGPSSGNGIETVAVTSNSTSRMNALTSTDGTTQTMTTLTVAGAGSFRINSALDFKGTSGTINASSATGAVDLQVGTEAITMTGGSGNDILRFATAGDLDSLDSINLGTGDDMIVLADTSAGASTTAALNTAINASTAEIIGFSAAATVDASRITPNIFAMASTTDVALTVQQLESADIVRILTGTNAGADLTISGQLGFNTANLHLMGTSTARVSVDDVTAQNLATLNIVSNGTSGTVNLLDNLILSDNAVVTITGANGLTITNALANTAVAINGSAMTGALTVTAGTTASSLTGGSGNDVLTGGTGADTFVGGDGDDTINTGADGAVTTVITGGNGADAVNLQHVAASAAVTTYNVTAAQSFATAGKFDTITISDNTNAQAASNTITLVTGVLTTTVTGATSVTLGTTAVTAGSFLAVGSTSATLTATDQNFQIYQDSNSNGVIDATDLRVDVTDAAGDTTAVSIVGNQLVIVHAGVA